jgi:serine/threonine protein kinase
MAKIYGGRWQIVDGKAAIGKGGQAEVFRVVDTRHEYDGEYALKRILNPARHARFLNEIEAIKRIQHPNIIKLVDHSALDNPNGETEKQFLVMPIADGGNFRAAGRASIYKDTIDGVVVVGKQLASALAAAHAKGVIHRDVKPENILFTGVGHEIWLSDFGICLLREQTRSTDAGEVVGPRAFLAPELEDGGQLDVTPAADVYSLGKLLYYAISGGVILPRERLHEERYNQIFLRGERHQLLQTLLQQMICPFDQRLKDMTEVARRLEKIETWEKEARLLAISPEALARIQNLQSTAQENLRINVANSAARVQEAEKLSAVKRGFETWLQPELEKVAACIAGAGILKSEVRPISESSQANWNIQTAPNGGYRTISGFEICLRQPEDPFHWEHILQIRLCEELRIIVTSQVGPFRPKAQPLKDKSLAMIPVYRRASGARASVGTEFGGFFSMKEAAGRVRGVLPSPGPRPYPHGNTVRTEAVTKSFLQGVTQVVPFRASEWPLVTDRLRAGLQQAIDSFIEFVDGGANVIGN